MEEKIDANIKIGFLFGILLGVLVLFIPAPSLSNALGLGMLFFFGGFIAGLFREGKIQDGIQRGAIVGAIISFFSAITIPGNSNFPIDFVFIAFILVPGNIIGGIMGISLRDTLVNVFDREKRKVKGEKQYPVKFLGICISSAITLAPLVLGPYLGYGLMLDKIWPVVIICSIIGGFVAGIFSDHGLIGGLRTSILSAGVVYFVLFCIYVLLPYATGDGISDGTGFAILALIFIGGLLIVFYPIGGVIGAYQKSLSVRPDGD